MMSHLDVKWKSSSQISLTPWQIGFQPSDINILLDTGSLGVKDRTLTVVRVLRWPCYYSKGRETRTRAHWLSWLALNWLACRPVVCPVAAQRPAICSATRLVRPFLSQRQHNPSRLAGPPQARAASGFREKAQTRPALIKICLWFSVTPPTPSGCGVELHSCRPD